eukprot:9512556-Prorocentrum_lima.AAC.1
MTRRFRSSCSWQQLATRGGRRRTLCCARTPPLKGSRFLDCTDYPPLQSFEISSAPAVGRGRQCDS